MSSHRYPTPALNLPWTVVSVKSSTEFPVFGEHCPLDIRRGTHLDHLSHSRQRNIKDAKVLFDISNDIITNLMILPKFSLTE